uniref:RNA exonuclease 1 homolog n=1 Tax=Monodelphis domestica TaxID=13616 RepID=F6XNL7_MONDO
MEKLESPDKEIESVKAKIEENQKKVSKYAFKCQSTVASFLWNDSHYGKNSPENDGLPKEYDKEEVRSNNYQSESRKYVKDHRSPAADLENDPFLDYSAGLVNTAKGKQDKIEKKLFLNSTKPGLENWKEYPKKQRSFLAPIKLEINLESDDDDLIIDEAPLVPVSRKSRIIKRYKICNMDDNIHIPPPEEGNLINSDTGLTSLIREERELQEETNNMNPEQFEKPHKTATVIQNAGLQCINQGSKIENLINQDKINAFISKENTEKQVPIEMYKADYPKDENVLKRTYNGHKKPVECHHSLKVPQISYSESFSKGKIMSMKDTHKKPDEDKVEYIQRKVSYKKMENASFAISYISKPSYLVDLVSGKTDTLNSYDHLSNYDKNGKINCNLEESEVIVITSSESSDSDDPVEECLQVFNEFTESTTQKEENNKQFLGKHMESSTMDLKTVLTPGPKKRIAHTAKLNVPATKRIINPFQGRNLQVQQQAMQITTTTKRGKAFVAATSKQKKHPVAYGSSQHPSTGSHNWSEPSPAVADSTHFNEFLSEETFLTIPSRPTLPAKNIVPLSAKPTKNKAFKRKRKPMTWEYTAKVPNEMRERYVSFFIEEYLKICKTTDEAFHKALIEEKAIYKRSSIKNIYLNIAVNALKKLRDQDLSCPESLTEYRKQEEKKALTGVILYRHLKKYLLTEDQLNENNYPQPNPEKPGCAVLKNGITKSVMMDGLRKICCRCGKIYHVTPEGKYTSLEECNYHFGTVVRHKVPGGSETQYSCCEGIIGSPGCQTAKLHVHNDHKENLEGFVKTSVKLPPPDGNPGVFAVDCEVCYTSKGLELVRVTVVDPSLQVVYDTLVKPENEIIDYNIRFSGVAEDDLKNTNVSLQDVQAILLNLFSADTILIGHSFEKDLLALKLIHNTVIDTSILFPHRLGLPHRRALKNLIADYLRRIIQNNVGGHSPSEDAIACMELILWKVKDDVKGKK